MSQIYNKSIEERITYCLYVKSNPEQATEDLFNLFCRCRPCEDDDSSKCVFMVVGQRLTSIFIISIIIIFFKMWLYILKW